MELISLGTDPSLGSECHGVLSANNLPLYKEYHIEKTLSFVANFCLLSLQVCLDKIQYNSKGKCDF